MTSIPQYTTERQPGKYLSVQGGCLKSFEVKGPRAGRSDSQPIKRGNVNEFSRKSRKRLMDFVASLDYERMASDGLQVLFVTLTTSRGQWSDTRRFYIALRKFHQFLKEQPGFQGAIVKREYGAKNGALHAHLEVFGTSFIPVNKMRHCWTEAMQSKTVLRVGVERARSVKEVSTYLAKYTTKMGYQRDVEEPRDGDPVAGQSGEFTSPDGPDTGEAERGTGDPVALSLSKGHNGQKEEYEGYNGHRWWYVWGRDRLPLGEVCEVESPEIVEVAKRVRRVLRKWLVRVSELSEVKKARKYYENNPQPMTDMDLQRWIKADSKRFSRKKKAGNHLRGFFEFPDKETGEVCRFRSSSYTVYCNPKLLEKVLFWAIEGEENESD